jgi:DNA-binding NtrC family response regulator
LEESASFRFHVTERSLPSVPTGDSSQTNYSAGRGAQFDLVLLCLSEEGLGAAEATVEALQSTFKEIPIVLVVESAEPRQLCNLLRRGASDFLMPPFRSPEVIPRLLRLIEHAGKADSPIRSLKEKLGLKQFIGESDIWMQEIAKIPKVAQCDASVLITGETGTGKEMVARAIHYLSPRNKRAFVPVNCGAIPTDLMENELFGHEAGAFTGATGSISGLICDSDGGTLFLDEIDSLPLNSQVKLLRFLQDKEYRPLGSRKTFRADVRVIAASNVNFEETVGSGKFRSDLYYRLNVIPFCLPPLRKRKEDIPPLAFHLLGKHLPDGAVKGKSFSPAALEKLIYYDWPGNVRELENIIQRAAILSSQLLITSEDICLPASTPSAAEMSFKILKAKAVAEFERSCIRQLLAASGGNIAKAAYAAKKNRRAFWQLMQKHHISSGRAALR